MTRPIRPPEAHLRENRADVTPASANFRAFPIGDPNRPHTMPDAIVAYLDVENSPRYQPTSARTYCNVYACDYCYLLEAYLPRVWWTDEALERITAGEQVEPAYGKTVAELSANSLYDWLEVHGIHFGWTPENDLNAVQRAGNEWRAAVIAAKNRNARRSGHITVIINEDFGRVARRDEDENVILPVQSQAGRFNRAASTGDSPWWLGGQFGAHRFWTHRGAPHWRRSSRLP